MKTMNVTGKLAPFSAETVPGQPLIALRQLGRWWINWTKEGPLELWQPLREQRERVELAIKEYRLNQGTQAEKASLENVRLQISKLESLL